MNFQDRDIGSFFLSIFVNELKLCFAIKQHQHWTKQDGVFHVQYLLISITYLVQPLVKSALNMWPGCCQEISDYPGYIQQMLIRRLFTSLTQIRS